MSNTKPKINVSYEGIERACARIREQQKLAKVKTENTIFPGSKLVFEQPTEPKSECEDANISKLEKMLPVIDKVVPPGTNITFNTTYNIDNSVTYSNTYVVNQSTHNEQHKTIATGTDAINAIANSVVKLGNTLGNILKI